MGMNRRNLILLAAAGLLAGGCGLFHHKAQPAPPKEYQHAIITPDTSLAAKVISVNAIGRFVVLGFPLGQKPKPDQIFFLYRGGLKTAEVRITEIQNENNIVADLVSGDAQVGDLVRDQ